MAYFHLLSTDPKSAVFVDFWGRFTVYSLWFIGFALYVKYVSKTPVLRLLVLLVIAINIPLFLLLAYFDKISNTPDMIVFVDFWGRILSTRCGLCAMKLIASILGLTKNTVRILLSLT